MPNVRQRKALVLAVYIIKQVLSAVLSAGQVPLSYITQLDLITIKLIKSGLILTKRQLK